MQAVQHGVGAKFFGIKKPTQKLESVFFFKIQ